MDATMTSVEPRAFMPQASASDSARDSPPIHPPAKAPVNLPTLAIRITGRAKRGSAIIGSGIQLIKYWFEVSQEEQTRRFKDRINDPRKIWKLSEHGTVLASIKLPASAEDLVYADRALWVAAGEAGTVVRIDPMTNANDRRWATVHVDLAPWAGRTVELVLRVRGTPGAPMRTDSAGWGDPRLVGGRMPS